jgi:hypothetical protein
MTTTEAREYHSNLVEDIAAMWSAAVTHKKLGLDMSRRQAPFQLRVELHAALAAARNAGVSKTQIRRSLRAAGVSAKAVENLSLLF